ncbi:hypothetical protein Gorai_019803, partial [Gossypium raimondii]|nr:hypothetical protein [Gossypium raimondii]
RGDYLCPGGSIRADLGVVRAEIVGDALSGIKKLRWRRKKIADGYCRENKWWGKDC